MICSCIRSVFTLSKNITHSLVSLARSWYFFRSWKRIVWTHNSCNNMYIPSIVKHRSTNSDIQQWYSTIVKAGANGANISPTFDQHWRIHWFLTSKTLAKCWRDVGQHYLTCWIMLANICPLWCMSDVKRFKLGIRWKTMSCQCHVFTFL